MIKLLQGDVKSLFWKKRYKDRIETGVIVSLGNTSPSMEKVEGFGEKGFNL